jgi:hypothetical protein
VNVDFTVGKTFRLGERQNLRFRAEFFNLFNHPLFQNPLLIGNANVEATNPNGSSANGEITQTNGVPRLIQFLAEVFVLGIGRLEDLLVCLGRQSGDADAAVAFMANVEADEQGSDLLEDASVFQFAAVDGADTGNRRGERARELRCVGVVAADDDIAIERIVSV